MMAPVCVACRLLLLVPLVFVLFLSTVCKNVDSLLVYDRQTLLNIRSATNDLVNYDQSEQRTSLPFVSAIPFYLWCTPVPLFRRRRYRHRGKRSGLLVKIKRYLAKCFWINHYTTLAENKLDRRRVISWHSMDSVNTGLITLISRDVDVPPPRSPRLRRGGVNLQSLRPLDREPLMAEGLTPTRIALVNARSLTNKSFILNDFFTSRALDFLCVTETWLNASELSSLFHVFSEVLPIDCTYFNSPRSSGRGGGVATIFKEKFECHQLSSDIYSSFELNIF